MLSEYLRTVATPANAGDWRQQFAGSFRADGDGVGALLVKEGAFTGQSIGTQNEFDTAKAEGTIDDLIRLGTCLSGTAPNLLARAVRNVGTSLATMGRIESLLPGAVRNMQTAAGGSMSVNQVYNYAVSNPLGESITLPGTPAFGDQVDITNEGYLTPCNLHIVKHANQGGGDLWSYAQSGVFYFTTFFNGVEWIILQS
ncbi:MAG: hypothetical protein SFY81_04955 [Verrucomicrobiota bacterium]|nr:hypothetical protein [Verrucomicrobiota bacterium]